MYRQGISSPARCPEQELADIDRVDDEGLASPAAALTADRWRINLSSVLSSPLLSSTTKIKV
jgi:hypothetical protein